MGHLCCKKARERPDTMRVSDDCEGSALEKRTCGEVLDAVPPHQRRMLRNLLEADVNSSAHHPRSNAGKRVSRPTYLRMPSFVMTVL